MSHTYQYPHPAMTADIVVITSDHTEVLLIQRKNEPYAGMWALPGGFVNIDETVKNAAIRELEEETGLAHIYLQPIALWDEPHRDPRERVISQSFLALVDKHACRVKAGDDAAHAAWHPLAKLPLMAFDHMAIIYDAMATMAIQR